MMERKKRVAIGKAGYAGKDRVSKTKRLLLYHVNRRHLSCIPRDMARMDNKVDIFNDKK
jgi:hypothetical protein